MNEIPRVVFDTNILFSAVGWLGNPHQCVQGARQGKCLSLTCEPILAELAEKLQLKRGFDTTKAADYMGDFGDEGDITEETKSTNVESVNGESPVVKFVNMMLTEAVKENASDIHVEPYEKKHSHSFSQRWPVIRKIQTTKQYCLGDFVTSQSHGQNGFG